MFFFFGINNKDLLISPKYTGGIEGGKYQIQKLHKSSISKIEEKGWFLHTENQYNKVKMFYKQKTNISGILTSILTFPLLLKYIFIYFVSPV